MNKNWRNRPTTIDFISKSDVDVIICIDESGDSDLKGVLEALRSGKTPDDNERYFTVTACIIKMDHFEQIRDSVMDLKSKYWSDALYSYKGISKRVHFHSRDIRGCKEAFSKNVIDYNSFISDLSGLMKEVPIKLYASHIDKYSLVKTYAFPAPTYDLCMNFVLERAMMDLILSDKCIVVCEARGRKEDKALLQEIKQLIDKGNNFNPATLFNKIKGVYFNPKWCKIASDQQSYWELELADLCAYPIHKFFKYGTTDKAFEVLAPRISHYPNFLGRGLKRFP